MYCKLQHPEPGLESTVGVASKIYPVLGQGAMTILTLDIKSTAHTGITSKMELIISEIIKQTII